MLQTLAYKLDVPTPSSPADRPYMLGDVVWSSNQALGRAPVLLLMQGMGQRELHALFTSSTHCTRVRTGQDLALNVSVNAETQSHGSFT